MCVHPYAGLERCRARERERESTIAATVAAGSAKGGALADERKRNV